MEVQRAPWCCARCALGHCMGSDRGEGMGVSISGAIVTRTGQGIRALSPPRFVQILHETSRSHLRLLTAYVRTCVFLPRSMRRALHQGKLHNLFEPRVRREIPSRKWKSSLSRAVRDNHPRRGWQLADHSNVGHKISLNTSSLCCVWRYALLASGK